MAQTFETPWHGVETAGEPALSFANTLDWRLRETPVELFHEYEDLLRWARTEGALTPAEARTLRDEARAHPRTAARVFKEALVLREAMAVLWEAAATCRALPEAELAELDRIAAPARAAQVLKSDGTSAAWAWRSADPELERPLWAAALMAVRLLTAPELAKVRQCADDACGWFFLDTSKNRSRRWCSMESCGNRNKARRFYKRSRG